MPSIRIGFSTDFNLVGEQVGIGTTNPTARLEVAGQILADNTAGSGGISTLTTYDGFLQSAQGIGNTVSIAETTKGNLNSLSGEIKISGEVTVGSATTITGGRLDSLSITDKFDLPSGGTNERLNTAEKGSTRFNQDLGQLEFYTGLEWRTVGSYADTGGRGRGIFPGGNAPSLQRFIGFVNISTTGNEQSFGDLTSVLNAHANVASSTRGVTGGGQNPATINDIRYITIASEGDAIDFGDMTSARRLHAAVSSSTRGVFGNADANVIDYIQISTTGNAVDFGDAVRNGSSYTGRNYAACGSPTRGLFIGGTPSPGQTAISSLTIASKGNTVDFGEQLFKSLNSLAASNSTRGIYNYGSGSHPAATLHTAYLTIATQGSSAYFGDLSATHQTGVGAPNQVRTLIAGGTTPSSFDNTIEYMTFSTAGDAVDFGDLSIARGNMGISACSDSHGGLGGF